VVEKFDEPIVPIELYIGGATGHAGYAAACLIAPKAALI